MAILFNKKGYGGMPKFVAIVLGLLVLAAGVALILTRLGVLTTIPAVPGVIVEIIIILAGILMLIEGFKGVGN